MSLAEKLDDEEPITLAEACQIFPRAKLTPSTLRAEATRGRLGIFRLGKRDYTTPGAMRAMVQRCQEDDYRRDSISIRSGKSGSSVTGHATSARASIEK